MRMVPSDMVDLRVLRVVGALLGGFRCHPPAFKAAFAEQGSDANLRGRAFSFVARVVPCRVPGEMRWIFSARLRARRWVGSSRTTANVHESSPGAGAEGRSRWSRYVHGRPCRAELPPTPITSPDPKGLHAGSRPGSSLVCFSWLASSAVSAACGERGAPRSGTPGCRR